MATAPQLRTLKIAEKQALLLYEEDANGLYWHHRILFRRVRGSLWVVGTPDRAVFTDDIGEHAIRPLRADGVFPADVAGQIYCFDRDALTQEELNVMRAEARDVADLVGAEDQAAATGNDDEMWVVAEVDHADFGKELGLDELADNSRTVILDGTKGVHTLGDDYVFIENIYREDLEAWTAAKRPGLPGGAAGDFRLLGNFQNRRKQRQLSLQRALELMSEEQFDDWPFRGPRAVLEFSTGVEQAGGDLVNYFGTYVRRSGISDKSAVYHKLKCLFEVVRLGVSYDQLDASNIAAMEQVVRRIVQVQMAIRRNPRHPTFEGLDGVLSASTDDSGGVALRAFSQWFADEQSREGKMLKAQRLWRDELVADRDHHVEDSGARGSGDGVGSSWKAKKKPKAKARAAAGGSGEAP